MGACILLVLSLSFSLLFFYLNHTYELLFVKELKGIYPPIFWEGANVDKVAPYLPSGLRVKEEVFDQRVELDLLIYPGGDPVRIWTGVRSLDFSDAATLPELAGKIGDVNASADAVWISSRLFELIFSDEPVDQYQAGTRSIYLKGKYGGYKELPVAGVFRLLNQERWMIVPAGVLDTLRIRWQTTRVLTVYGGNRNTDIAALSDILPTRYLYQWFDRLPFFYDCFWKIIQGGVKFMGASLGAVLFFYLLNLIQMSYIEIKTSLFLVRIFGASKFRFMLWAFGVYALLICFLTASTFLFAAMPLYIIDSPVYHLTISHYVSFLKETIPGLSRQISVVTLVVFLVALPNVFLAMALFTKTPVRILGARL